MNIVSSALKDIKQIKPLKPLRRHGRIMLSTKWLLRGALLFLMMLVMSAAVGIYIVQSMFTPEHVSMLICSKLQDALHRPVVVENARLLIYKGLKVDRVRVLGRKEDILSAGPMEFSYSWMPLLFSRLEVNTAVMENVRVNVVADSSGTWRLGDMEETVAGSGDAANGADRGSVISLLRLLSSANVTINNASLLLKNEGEAARKAYTLSALQLWGFSVDRNTPFRVEFEYEGGSGPTPVRAGFYAEGRFNLAGLNLASATLTDTDIQVNAFRSPAYIKLSAENFLEPVASVSATLPALDDKDLYQYIGKPLGLTLPKTKIKGQLAYAGGRLGLKDVVMTGGGMSVRAKGGVLFSSAAAGPQYDIALRSNNVELGNLGKHWGGFREYFLGGKATLSLGLAGTGKPSVKSLRLRSRGAKGIFLGFMVSDADFTLAVDSFTRVSLDLNNATVKAGATVFSNLRGDMKYDGENLRVSDLAGKYDGTAFRFKTEIADFKNHKKRDIHTVMRIHELDMGKLFGVIRNVAHAISPHPLSKPLSGQLAWLRNFRARVPDFMPRFRGSLYSDKLVTPVISGHNLKIEFNLRGLGNGMGKVSGKIDARLENGVVYQLERMAETDPALNVAFRPFLAMHRMETSGAFQIGSVLRDVSFRSMAASTNWVDGAMWLNSFYFDGSTVSAYMNGMTDWTGEKLDLNIYTRFNARRGFGGLSESLTDDSGNPALSFNIKGPMHTPKVTMRSPNDVGKKITEASAKGIRTEFKEIQNYLNTVKPDKGTAAAAGRKNVGTK